MTERIKNANVLKATAQKINKKPKTQQFPRKRSKKIQRPAASFILQTTRQLVVERAEDAESENKSGTAKTNVLRKTGALALQETQLVSSVSSICGRLINFLRKWSDLTSDKTILSWVRGFEIPFNAKVFRNKPPSEYEWSVQEEVHIPKQ